jgi:hypothetical protein
MKLLLDNGPLGQLAAVTRDDWSWSAGTLHTERLRSRYTHTSKNSGEDASIALLAHELVDGTFVTMDAKAALLALVELGGHRVMAPFDCWRWLLDQGHIDDVACRDLDDRTSKTMGLRGPPPRLS